MIKYKTIDYRKYNKDIYAVNKIREKEPIKLINFTDMIFYSIPFNHIDGYYNFVLHTDINTNQYKPKISYYWYGKQWYSFKHFKQYSKWKNLDWRKKIEMDLFL